MSLNNFEKKYYTNVYQVGIVNKALYMILPLLIRFKAI